jgi:hypothetical protein
MKHAPSLFVMFSSDRALISAFSRGLPEHAQLKVVGSFAEVLEQSMFPHLRGVVIDGRSLEAPAAPRLDRLRNQVPLAQILYVAADLPAALFNELQPLRIDIVARPLPAGALGLFVERALTAGRLPSKSVDAYIDQLASAHRLSGKEISLFSVVLDNETAEEACQRLGFDEAVFSRTMRRLLKKCHMRSKERLAKSVMRDALLSTRTITASLVEPLSKAAGF